jgi:UDP-N-acetylmuramate dehydrogenase
MNQTQRDQLAADWPAMCFDQPMAACSTLRAGGRAAGFIDITCQEDLARLLQQLDRLQLLFQVIGRGSNILVSDQGYAGIILRLRGRFLSIERIGSQDPVREKTEMTVKAGAGCSMAALLSWCSSNSLSGLEFMAGIPGSVGGAVGMNAGAWGHEIGDQLLAIELVDCQGQSRQLKRSELQMSYRRLALDSGSPVSGVIVSASLQLTADKEEQIRASCRKYLGRRKGKQPVGVASAGSFFKNPAGDSAGRLIEAAGLKGLCQGEAMVSPVHANFIVNTGKATATDIVQLMERVQTEVWQRFSVSLEPEVQIL